MTEKYAQTGSVLNGRSKRAAMNFIYKIVEKYTKSIYSDTFWEPVQAIWKLFGDAGIDWTLTKPSQYFKDEQGNPNRKVWYFKVNFMTPQQRQSEINGTITAAGAGSVQQPLDKYDITVVMF